MSAAFDTLAAARALKDAGMEPDHAEAVAEMGKAAAAADRDQLATKADLAALKADLSVLRAELLNRLYTVAAALAGLMVALKFFP